MGLHSLKLLSSTEDTELSQRKYVVGPSESAAGYPRDNLFLLLWQPEEVGTWMNSRIISPDIQGIFIFFSINCSRKLK